MDAIADPRAAGFAFNCTRCSRCCANKRIQTNPYEIARLARRFGMTTGTFAARWTVGGAGSVLRKTETGACVFLGPEGCTVHSDRPLVCRLFPLGRYINENGVERFSLVEEGMLPAGEITRDGTIGAYIEAQGAEPFIKAADDYFFWLIAAYRQLRNADSLAAEISSTVDGCVPQPVLDMDDAIASWTEMTGIEPPADFDERCRLHLDILYRSLDQGPEETSNAKD